MAAIQEQNVTQLRDLLQGNPSKHKDGAVHGVNVNYQIVGTTKTPLLLAVGPLPVHSEMVQLLLDHNANVEEGESYHGISPLMAAVNVQNMSLVELLLQHGANVNTQAADGKTPLIQMARSGNLPLLQLLLDWGAHVHIYDEQAKNALMYACSENRLNIVQYLLSLPTVHVNDYKVDTPLWHACAAGHVEIVQQLLYHGAQIEYRLDGTIYSTTPLMEACEWGHDQVVELLLHHGADVTSRTGRKALTLAQRSGYHKAVQCMERWKKRLEGLEMLVDTGTVTDVPATWIPLVLALAGQRPALTHRIMTIRVDVLASR